MAESTRIVELVQADIDRFLDEREGVLGEIAPDLLPLVALARDLLRGGKRFRALFCYWGWQATAGAERSPENRSGVLSSGAPARAADLQAVLLTASALEVFHAAALVHDDIIDNSDTRRGRPAVHKRFESMHESGRWIGDGATFGQSAALLVGDLLLGWSDELFDSGLRLLAAPAARVAARSEFNTMRTDVTVGQYLDILDERSWQSYDEQDLLERAHRVIVYKSAKYSIEAPLAIGGLLGGATPEQVLRLRAFGLPLGIAYQLRDDLLGVFGDPVRTGKPAGDDLREGKRTVLIALARTRLPAEVRTELDELLGYAGLSEVQVKTLQDHIRSSGAVESVEGMIDRNVGLALEALSGAPIDTAARESLTLLADAVTRRAA